jgi:hypothetical protein
MTVVRREVSDRTFMGKVVKWTFVAFNALMLVWLISGMMAVSDNPVGSEAEEAGRAIGTAMGATMILGLWAIGDVILGILVLLTRRKKIIEVSE